jgi:hypothetical protein
MTSILEPPVSDETAGKGISLKLTPAAHENLKALRLEIAPGHRFTIPEIINGVLENISLDQVQGLMKSAIDAKLGESQRKERIAKLLADTPLDELEALLASRKS